MVDAISHDQNFKNLILDYPRDALGVLRRREAPLPDEEVRIVPAQQEQLQARPGRHFRELDVPLLVEWTDGRREAILFALEEESDMHRAGSAQGRPRSAGPPVSDGPYGVESGAREGWPRFAVDCRSLVVDAPPCQQRALV